MYRSKVIATALCSGVFALCINHADAQEFTAKLNGFNEIGSTPSTTPAAGAPTGYTGAVLTDATGTLKLNLDKKASQASYTLTYTGSFTSAVQQAHIHFGKSRDSGGIMVWLCQTMAKPSPVPTTPTCPQPNPSATVSGTLTSADVLALTGQNVTKGDFDALEDALNSNTAYANIHTATFGGGEIRGQVRAAGKDGGHDEKHDNHEHN
jgi:hypothetical protein